MSALSFGTGAARQRKTLMPNAPLSVGSYGDSVARLQDFLRQLGFQLPASEVNRTFFGPATRQAVQLFEQQNGLPVSGVVDEQTAALLQRQMEARTGQGHRTDGSDSASFAPRGLDPGQPAGERPTPGNTPTSAASSTQL